MDLALLDTFLELNRSRHFGRAADALFVTQAAVSSRLKSLEQQLGVTLIDRSRREFRLTRHGLRLVPHAKRMVAAWRLAQQEVAVAESGEQLVIGGSFRIWDVLMQHGLHDLRRSQPNPAIVAELQTPNVLTRRLINGTLDIAIMLEPTQLDILHIREIDELQFVLVSTKAPANVDEALARTIVDIDWGPSFGIELRRHFPDLGESMTGVSSPGIALSYLADIGGSAFFPRRMIESQLDAGMLHEVDDAPPILRRVYAVNPVRSPRSGLIEKCLALV